MANYARELTERQGDPDLDERIAALKARIDGQAPVTARRDLSIVEGTPREPTPPLPAKPRYAERGCKTAGCESRFHPTHSAQRYCPTCQVERKRGAPKPELHSVKPPPPIPPSQPRVVSPPPERRRVPDHAPLRDRLLCRLENTGVRLFTKELASGLQVVEPLAVVEGELWLMANDGVIDAVTSWRTVRA